MTKGVFMENSIQDLEIFTLDNSKTMNIMALGFIKIVILNKCNNIFNIYIK